MILLPLVAVMLNKLLLIVFNKCPRDRAVLKEQALMRSNKNKAGAWSFPRGFLTIFLSMGLLGSSKSIVPPLSTVVARLMFSQLPHLCKWFLSLLKAEVRGMGIGQGKKHLEAYCFY